MENNLLKLLQSDSITSFIKENGMENTKTLALKFNGKVNFNLILACEQIELRQKAAQKLPQWVKAECGFTRRAYEQCTAEKVALFRSKLINSKKTLDLTAGLGVDAWALAQKNIEVTVVERNGELRALLDWNFKKLGATISLRPEFDALETVQNIKADEFDTVFFDPDRRPDEIRTNNLHAYSPNPIEIVNALGQKVNQVFIKLSPMVDITALKADIPAINSVGIISLKNEMKEVLAIIDYQKPAGFSVFIAEADNETIQHTQDYTSIEKIEPQPLKSYLIEPPVGVIKVQLSGEWGKTFNLHPISIGSTLLTAENKTDCPGRWFQIIEVLKYKPNQIKTYLKANGISKANISCRNFGIKPEEIKKSFKLNDGGSVYLFFTTLLNDERVCIVTKKA